MTHARHRRRWHVPYSKKFPIPSPLNNCSHHNHLLIALPHRGPFSRERELKMASSSSRLSYQRLRKVPEGIEEDEVGGARAGEEVVVVESSRRRRSWPRLEGRRRWRRPRVRVAGLQWLLRRKAKLVSNALAKILKRLKEGRPYVGELFAGNYMFMQVSPSPTMGYMGSKYSLPGHPKNAFNPSPSSSDHVARGVWT